MVLDFGNDWDCYRIACERVAASKGLVRRSDTSSPVKSAKALSTTNRREAIAKWRAVAGVRFARPVPGFLQCFGYLVAWLATDRLQNVINGVCPSFGLMRHRYLLPEGRLRRCVLRRGGLRTMGPCLTDIRLVRAFWAREGHRACGLASEIGDRAHFARFSTLISADRQRYRALIGQ